MFTAQNQQLSELLRGSVTELQSSIDYQVDLSPSNTSISIVFY